VATEERKCLEIEDGQSKFELFAQLTDIGRIEGRPTFDVTAIAQNGSRHKVELEVDGIQAIDHLGTFWKISGFARNRSMFSGWRCFSAHYSTRTRKGTLWIEES